MRRTPQGTPDRYLIWKISIFFLAAGVWIAGAITGRRWLTAAAIVVLFGAIVARFLPTRRNDQGSDG